MGAREIWEGLEYKNDLPFSESGRELKQGETYVDTPLIDNALYTYHYLIPIRYSRKWKAVPHRFSIWTVQINGIKEDHYSHLFNMNPKLTKKYAAGSITAKWKVNGAGSGNFPPMSVITPLLNIIEDWGYQLHTCCSVGADPSDYKIGKLWTLKKKDCFRMMLPPQQM